MQLLDVAEYTRIQESLWRKYIYLNCG